MRKRVSLIILKNKKILMVKDLENFYFTPGGGVKDEETNEQAIYRECKEELSINPISYKFYISYITKSHNTSDLQEVYCYFVELDIKKIKLDNEVSQKYWYSRTDYYRNKPEIAYGIYNNLIPALIKDNFM